ncbi:MAG: alpha/beta hydrolase [archaeon]
MNVIMIHGSYGNPEENWFPWLKKELEKIGCKVFIPKFPTPKNQSLNNWMKVLESYKQYLDESSIIIGHSLGPAFILTVLEKLDKRIKASFFVAGFVSWLGNEDFDKINKTFVNKKFEWDKIKKNCGKFILYSSDNDPYVPLKKSQEIADKVGVSINIIRGAGHFNKNSRYTKFNKLLEDIKNIKTK